MAFDKGSKYFKCLLCAMFVSFVFGFTLGFAQTHGAPSFSRVMDVFVKAMLKLTAVTLVPFQLGPVCVFLSPLSLCPVPLPWFVPFRHSFVALTLWDVPVPLSHFFLLFHLCPCVYLTIPSLSALSLRSLPQVAVDFSLVSLSTAQHPLEVASVGLGVPLRSLLTLKWFDARLGMALFPGVRQKLLPPSAPSEEFVPAPLEQVPVPLEQVTDIGRIRDVSLATISLFTLWLLNPYNWS